MRRLLSLAVLVALCATSCSQVSDALSGPDPTPVKVKVSGGDRPTQGQARAGVLRERDLPARWVPTPVAPER